MPVQQINSADAAAFRAEINRRVCDMVEKCFHCGKCSAGCPIADEMDLMPNQVMRLVQLGQFDQVLSCRSIWLCASCVTCSTRCPQGVPIASVMEALRHLALERGIEPPEEVRHVQTFTRAFLSSVRRHGRVFEPGMVMGFNLRSRQFMKDAGKGPAMFLKGKLGILPHRVKNLAAVRRIFKKLAPKL